MAPAARGCLERARRAARTVIFMVSMLISLLTSTFPVVLVAVGDVALPFAIISSLLTPGGGGITFHLRNYSFRASLIDFPLVSALRSLIILSVYSTSDAAAMSHGPYLGAVSVCSIVSVVMLFVKACVYTVTSPHFDAVPVSLSVSSSISVVSKQKLSLTTCWALPILFLSSTAFALVHVVIAYRSSSRARRKLIFHRVDPEAVMSCKSIFSGYQKICRSPTPVLGRNVKCDSQSKRKGLGMLREEDEISAQLLVDADSLFAACNGLALHYKVCLPDTPVSTLSNVSILEINHRKATGRIGLDKQGSVSSSNIQKNHLHRSYSNQFNGSTLYTPLLEGSNTSPVHSDGIPALTLEYPVEDEDIGRRSTGSPVNHDLDRTGDVGVVFVHGFGGGVFSWRHVMSFLAQQACCRVVAFDRPGWGLTTRPRRKDWEDKDLPNPYMLDSQADLLLSFCSEMGFSSVVLVAHDDGGLIALKAAQKLQAEKNQKVTVRGIVLLNVSLSREVVPAFARILLRTSLGKKHLVRPLLRAEIIQVVNRCAWYDNAKLTTETLNLYKAPLCVEGWEEAMHEIGKVSCETVLSPQVSHDLVTSLREIPILVVAGSEDVLVPPKSCQAMASRFHNSRLVTIFGCGHLPHEECPKALLSAVTPFITRLLQEHHSSEPIRVFSQY